MIRSFLLPIFLLFISIHAVNGQDTLHSHNVYQLDFKKDAILLGSGLLLSLTGDIVLSRADPPLLSEISELRKEDVFFLDRSATDNFSNSAEKFSDIVLYSSIALPFTLYFLENTRGNELEMITMIAETFLITNGLTNISKGLAQRYRPYNYNPIVENEIKLGRTSRESFFSGHTSNSAAFSFLAARVINDLHPHWKWQKYFSWSLAAAVPLAIGYGRYKSGKHFPSDILAGYTIGAVIGMVIPQLHRTPHLKMGITSNHLSFIHSF